MSGVNQFLVLSRVNGGIILSLKVSASTQTSYFNYFIIFYVIILVILVRGPLHQVPTDGS